jgi:para-nitrobenzyl esterase
MASPLSRDLFAGAIGESGALIAPIAALPLKEAQAQGAAFMKQVGARSLEALRAMPADALLQASASEAVSAMPDIDGYFLTEQPAATFARGAQAHVPLLLGSNSQEGFYTAILHKAAPTPANYRAALQGLFGKQAERALALYPGGTPQEVKRSATALAGDMFIAHSTWRWMDLQRRSGQSVYFYEFTQPRPAKRHPAPGESPDPGAVHSGEIEYALGNLPGNPVYAWTTADHAVSRTMEGYVLHFVEAGNPNGPDLPKWPPAAASGSNVLRQVIDVRTHTEVDHHAARHAFLQRFFAVHANPL